jgi:hypothetical protein
MYSTMKRTASAAAFIILAGCVTPKADFTADKALGDPETYAVFAPDPRQDASIDYTLIDEFLSSAVLVTGPSQRARAPLPDRQTGTKMRIGQKSPLRLEGNKVLFSQFSPQTKEAVRSYADSLLEIANTADIPALPRNEQLAFWFNLHNMLVIAEIAEHYPVRYPSRIDPMGDGVPLHDAKFFTIKGVPMSLSDIRTEIVYRYWSDPRVIYGFFRGDLAGPNILPFAYTGEYVAASLDMNAEEFVNALRGVRGEFGPVLVSPIYKEAEGLLFERMPEDLKAHLLTYAGGEARGLLTSDTELAFMDYEESVADLAGGTLGKPIEPQNALAGTFGVPGLPTSARELSYELAEKLDALRRSETTTTIRIIDVATPGETIR